MKAFVQIIQTHKKVISSNPQDIRTLFESTH